MGGTSRLSRAPRLSNKIQPPRCGFRGHDQDQRAAISPIPFNLLSSKHQAVVDAVILRELSHEAAALELGLPKSTVTTRVEAAQKRLVELAQIIIPLSQRRPR